MRDVLQHIRRIRWNLLGLMVAFACILVLFLVILPLGAADIELYRRWSQSRSDFRSATEVIEQRETVEAEAIRLNTTLIELASTSELPEADVLPYIQRRAQASGVTLEMVRPGATDTVQAVQSTPLSIELEGRFHSIGQFLSSLENGTHPVELRTVHIYADKGAPSKLRAQLEMNSFAVMSANQAP